MNNTTTRPVWALPAFGAGAGALFGLLGGINVDDPNVVPSVKAKKLLRTLVLGTAAGLGIEAMLRGGGMTYNGLMSKSSSAKQIDRLRYKTLYSLIKQADEFEPTPIPANPANVEVEAPAVPTTTSVTPVVTAPATTTQVPTGNTAAAPQQTPPPATKNKAPSKEPWHSKMTAGIPNGYLGFGLGGLLGAGLLYHFLTEKKKRKPSGYLNSAGAGLLAGLLGYGLYDFTNRGWGTSATNSKKQQQQNNTYSVPQPEPTPVQQEERRIGQQATTLSNRVNGDVNRPPVNWSVNGVAYSPELNQALNRLYNNSSIIIAQAVDGPTVIDTYPLAANAAYSKEYLSSPNPRDLYADQPENFIQAFKDNGRQQLVQAIATQLQENNATGDINSQANALADQMLARYSSHEQLPARARSFSIGVTRSASQIARMPESPLAAMTPQGELPPLSLEQVSYLNEYTNRQASLLSKQLGRTLSSEEVDSLRDKTKELVYALITSNKLQQQEINLNNAYNGTYNGSILNSPAPEITALYRVPWLGGTIKKYAPFMREAWHRAFNPNPDDPQAVLNEDADVGWGIRAIRDALSPTGYNGRYLTLENDEANANTITHISRIMVDRAKEGLQNFYVDAYYKKYPHAWQTLPNESKEDSQMLWSTDPDLAEAAFSEPVYFNPGDISIPDNFDPLRQTEILAPSLGTGNYSMNPGFDTYNYFNSDVSVPSVGYQNKPLYLDPNNPLNSVEPVRLITPKTRYNKQLPELRSSELTFGDNVTPYIHQGDKDTSALLGALLATSGNSDPTLGLGFVSDPGLEATTAIPATTVGTPTDTKLNIGSLSFPVPEETPEAMTTETPRPTHNAGPMLLHPGSILTRPAEGSYWASQNIPSILHNAGYDVRGAKVAWNPDGTGNVVFADGTPNLKLNADGTFKPRAITPTNNTLHLGTLKFPVPEGTPTEESPSTTLNLGGLQFPVPTEQRSNGDNSSDVLPGQPQQVQPLPGDQEGAQDSTSLKDSPGPYIDPVTGTIVVGTGLGVTATGLGIASVSPMSPESALANPNQGGITRLKTKGQIPARAELQRYVDLIQGRITPEEFMSPGRTNELDDIIVKVTDPNASSISNGRVNRVINNEKVRGVAQQRITEIDGEIQSIFNNIDKTNPAAVSEANTKIDNLRAQRAKWEKISLAGSQIQPTAEEVANYNAQKTQLENDIKALQREELQLQRTPKQITGELKNTQSQLTALDRNWNKKIQRRAPSTAEQAAYTAQRDALQQQINSLTRELNTPRRTPIEIQTDISNARGQLQALNDSWTKPKFHPGYSEEFLLEDLREAMNIRDSISPQNQKLTAELEARLRQIDRFPELSARGEIKQALKREAVLGYLRDVHEAQVAATTDAKSNPIFSQWKNEATKAVDNIRLASGERLPWEYRVSPAEIDKIINDPIAETILKKPAVPGVAFSDAVKYANDPELIRAANNLEAAKDAVAKSTVPELKLQAQTNLQRAQEAFNQALSKHTYGSVFGNSIPEELANIPYEIGKTPNDILADIAKVKTPPRDLTLSRLEHPLLDPQVLPKNYREGAYLISGDLNRYKVDLNTKKHIVNQARARFGAGHPVTVEAEKAYAATAKEALRDTLRDLHIDQYIRGVASPGNPSLIYLQQLRKDPRIAKDPLLRGIVDDAFAAVKSDIAHIHPNNILQWGRELEPVDPEFKARLAEERQQMASNEERRIIEHNAAELERARQTKIQGLVERAEAYRNAGDIAGAEKIEAVLKKEFGVDLSVYNAVQEQSFIDDILTRPRPTLPKELGTKLRALREAEAAGDTATVSKLKEELNQLINGKKPSFWERMGFEWPGLTGPEAPRWGNFTERPWNMPEQINPKMSNPFDILGEQLSRTGLPEVPPNEPLVDSNASPEEKAFDFEARQAGERKTNLTQGRREFLNSEETSARDLEALGTDDAKLEAARIREKARAQRATWFPDEVTPDDRVFAMNYFQKEHANIEKRIKDLNSVIGSSAVSAEDKALARIEINSLLHDKSVLRKDLINLYKSLSAEEQTALRLHQPLSEVMPNGTWTSQPSFFNQDEIRLQEHVPEGEEPKASPREIYTKQVRWEREANSAAERVFREIDKAPTIEARRAIAQDIVNRIQDGHFAGYSSVENPHFTEDLYNKVVPALIEKGYLPPTVAPTYVRPPSKESLEGRINSLYDMQQQMDAVNEAYTRYTKEGVIPDFAKDAVEAERIRYLGAIEGDVLGGIASNDKMILWYANRTVEDLAADGAKLKATLSQIDSQLAELKKAAPTATNLEKQTQLVARRGGVTKQLSAIDQVNILRAKGQLGVGPAVNKTIKDNAVKGAMEAIQAGISDEALKTALPSIEYIKKLSPDAAEKAAIQLLQSVPASQRKAVSKLLAENKIKGFRGVDKAAKIIAALHTIGALDIGMYGLPEGIEAGADTYEALSKKFEEEGIDPRTAAILAELAGTGVGTGTAFVEGTDKLPEVVRDVPTLLNDLINLGLMGTGSDFQLATLRDYIDVPKLTEIVSAAGAGNIINGDFENWNPKLRNLRDDQYKEYEKLWRNRVIDNMGYSHSELPEVSINPSGWDPEVYKIQEKETALKKQLKYVFKNDWNKMTPDQREEAMIYVLPAQAQTNLYFKNKASIARINRELRKLDDTEADYLNGASFTQKMFNPLAADRASLQAERERLLKLNDIIISSQEAMEPFTGNPAPVELQDAIESGNYVLAASLVDKAKELYKSNPIFAQRKQKLQQQEEANRKREIQYKIDREGLLRYEKNLLAELAAGGTWWHIKDVKRRLNNVRCDLDSKYDISRRYDKEAIINPSRTPVIY